VTPSLRFLTKAESPLRAILVGWPVTTVPALALAALVGLLLPSTAQPQFGPVDLSLFAQLVLVAPLIETLIMAAVLEVLVRLMPARPAVVVSAIGWGAAHSLIAPAWGLVIWWVFLILSALYVTWRRRSLALAIAIPFAVHALNNLLPAIALLRSG
jgi:membrane protease YdiL (CAAX protease family)